jgi:uncharacterized protein YecA (UPF0149 family)
LLKDGGIKSYVKMAKKTRQYLMIGERWQKKAEKDSPCSSGVEDGLCDG